MADKQESNSERVCRLIGVIAAVVIFETWGRHWFEVPPEQGFSVARVAFAGVFAVAGGLIGYIVGKAIGK